MFLAVSGRAWTMVAILAIVFTAPTAAAAIIFDNGGYSGDQVGRYNGGSWTMYEDFTVTSSTVVGGLFWQQHDQAFSYSATNISFFNGVPSAGTLIASYAVAATRTPNALPVLFGNYAGYDYSVSGLNVPLTPGTYYFSIHNDSSGSFTTWDETAGVAATIAGRWQSGTSLSLGTFFATEDSVFQILTEGSGNTAVPEPATLSLLTAGFAVLAGLRMRRR